MTECRDHRLCRRDLVCAVRIAVDLSARRAGPVLNVSGRRAGCSLRGRLLHRMTECLDHRVCRRDLIFTVRIAEDLFAVRAGPVFRVTVLGTRCRLRSRLGHRMTECRNHGLRSRNLRVTACVAVDLFTYRTCPVCNVAGRSTGCCLRVRLRKMMSFRRDGNARKRYLILAVLIRETFFAIRAGPVLNIAGLGTGRILRRRLCERMTGRSDHRIGLGNFVVTVLIAEVLAAPFALPVLNVSGRRAGRCLRRRPLQRMAERRDHRLRRRDLRVSVRIAEYFSAG